MGTWNWAEKIGDAELCRKCMQPIGLLMWRRLLLVVILLFPHVAFVGIAQAQEGTEERKLDYVHLYVGGGMESGILGAEIVRCRYGVGQFTVFEGYVGIDREIGGGGLLGVGLRFPINPSGVVEAGVLTYPFSITLTSWFEHYDDSRAFYDMMGFLMTKVYVRLALGQFELEGGVLFSPIWTTQQEFETPIDADSVTTKVKEPWPAFLFVGGGF